MKSFNELLKKVTPAEKAWLGTIGPRDRKWTVEDIVLAICEKTGEEVDPFTIEEYLRRKGLPVHHADPSVTVVSALPFGGFSEAMEKDIEQALVSQLDALGLQLFIDENGRSGQQYPAGDHGRIDVLANDSKEDFVIIELTRDAPRATIGQVAGYIAFVRKHLAKPAGRSAFGWILARPSSSIDDRLLEEAADAVGIQVKWYRARVELLPDPPSIRLGPSAAA